MTGPDAGPPDVTDDRTRFDLRMVPLALAAWAGSWLGTGGGGVLVAVAGAAVAVAGFVAAWRKSGRWTAVAAVLVASAGIGLLHGWQLASGPVADLATGRAVVAAEVVTVSDPVLTPAKQVRPAFLTVRALVVEMAGRAMSWRLREPVLVTVSGDAMTPWRAAAVGSTFAVNGRLQLPMPGSDVAALLRVRGTSQVSRPPRAALRLADRVRRGLRTSVGHRGADVRALVPALVLGDTSGLTPDLLQAFQTTGLTHLMAVSGANLTLLLAFLLVSARWLGVRGWWLRGIGLAGVLVFVALCRTQPSVLRAAAMGLVALAALGSGSSRAGPRNLSVAMLALLLADPFLSRSYGFVLSVLASAGIVGWASGWTLVLRRWLPGPLPEAVTVPLAAQLATLPVVAQLSGSVSMVGLVANALAGPLVGPATVLGFVAAGLSLVSGPLAAVAGFGAAWSAQPIVWVARYSSRLPGASWEWPATPESLALLAAVSILSGLLMAHILARRWLTLLIALVMVVGLGRVPLQPGWPPPGWIFTACTVGQGDGLVVRVADRQAMVVDSGPDPTLMRRCLDQLGINHIPLLVLTHFHADHVDGLAGVLDDDVRQIWVSPLRSPPPEARRVLQVAQARHIAVAVPPPGTSGTVGDVVWRVLGPLTSPATASEEGSEMENDASLVIMVTVRGVRILLTGDVEPPGQQALLASGDDLRADVFKVPHHGSAQQEPAFFAATHASLAVASMGLGNDYGHPAPRTVALAQSLGMTFLRTDTQGSVAVTLANGRLAAVTQHQ